MNMEIELATSKVDTQHLIAETLMAFGFGIVFDDAGYPHYAAYLMFFAAGLCALAFKYARKARMIREKLKIREMARRDARVTSSATVET